MECRFVFVVLEKFMNFCEMEQDTTKLEPVVGPERVREGEEGGIERGVSRRHRKEGSLNGASLAAVVSVPGGLL